MVIIRFLDDLKLLLDNLTSLARENDAVLGLVALGSLGRDDLKANSDVNVAILVENGRVSHVKDQISREFWKILGSLRGLKLSYQQRTVFYLQGKVPLKNDETNKLVVMWKFELFFFDDLEVLFHHLEASEISPHRWLDAVLLDKKNIMRPFLLENLQELEKSTLFAVPVDYHISRFVELFEEASRAHSGGDSYRYVAKMLDAFYHLVVLHHVVKGKIFRSGKHLKYILESLPMSENFEFRDLIPDAHLENANVTKINYYQRFSMILDELERRGSLLEIASSSLKTFCKDVLKRDFFWNFRDVAMINPQKLKNNVIYRSAYLYHPAFKDEFLDLLKSHQIKTVIDLRSRKEIQTMEYQRILEENGVNYVNHPIDPQKHGPADVRLRYIEYTDDKQYRPALYEVLPRYLTKELHDVFKAFIIHEKPVLIHCHAGKDRTGMILALLLSVLGLTKEEIILDYRLATPDIDSTLIEVTLRVIKEQGQGTVLEYFMRHLGLSLDDVDALKRLFLRSES